MLESFAAGRNIAIQFVRKIRVAGKTHKLEETLFLSRKKGVGNTRGQMKIEKRKE